MFEQAFASANLPGAVGMVVDRDGVRYAAALGAARLFLLTDVAGVLDKSGTLLTDLTPGDIVQLQADGTISGGMIPKLETAMAAVRNGVEAVVILDGRRPHAMLVELFTEHGAGTLVKAS